jgi:hypothetical protein
MHSTPLKRKPYFRPFELILARSSAAFGWIDTLRTLDELHSPAPEPALKPKTVYMLTMPHIVYGAVIHLVL